jgi:hypothetical protein
MPNHIKFCSCHACRRGKRTPAVKAVTRNKVRSNRHAVKVQLVTGGETPKCISAGYTD